jgi:hypothetical protein
MSGSERLDPKCGPFGNLWQAYSNTLDGLAKGYEPAAVGLARFNLELMALSLRRAQAWLEVPTRLGRCRSPSDLVQEQAGFWQTAAAQYAEGSQRLLATLLSAGVAAQAARANASRDGRAVRDYIAVAEESEAPAARATKDRRAA